MSGEPGATAWGVGLSIGSVSQSYFCPSKPSDFHSPAEILNIISLNMVLWLISTLHAGVRAPQGLTKITLCFKRIS